MATIETKNFVAIHVTRRARRSIVQTRAHPVAWTWRELTRQWKSAEATPKQWLQALNIHADDYARQSQEWPRTVNQLGHIARVLQPGLQLLGIEISFRRRGNARLWRVETTECAAARRHFEATRPEGEAARIARLHEDKAIFQRMNRHIREMQRQERK